MLSIIETAKEQISQAQSFLDFAKVFATLFRITVAGQDPPKTPDEYKNENSDYGVKVKGKKKREALNEKAREILDRVKTADDMTAEDRDVLKQFSGKGGLDDNSQFEYYTPQHVAEGCWDALSANGGATGNICDPSTGAGMFSATKPQGVVITGCDIDPISSKIAQLLNPGDKISNQSFEKFCMETADNTFDAVMTNVPFGKARGKYMHDDPAYKSEKYIHRYFLMRIIDKLKPGGVAVLVVPTDIVGSKGDNRWLKFRNEVSLKAEFLGAHKLPSKTFSAQGTATVVDVVVFKKHPQDLLDKIDSIPVATLKAANVYFAEFIEGRYWSGEGRPFIMGKYMPKIDGDRWSRETVDGDVDDAGLKAKLSARFNSRIDWAALETAEPIVRNYVDGDRKLMNGSEYELVHGSWQKIVSVAASETIDSAKYGAGSIEELKSILQNPKLCLKLTAAQAFAIYKAFPELMGALPKAAIEFAMSQKKEDYIEQLWRGSLIGGMLGRYQAGVDEGGNDEDERLALQDIVTSEISKYGHPAHNKGLSLTGESSRAYGLFRNSVDTKGSFSDLLNGTLEGSGHSLDYDSTNLQSIVEQMYLKENITTISLEDLQKLYTGDKSIATLGDLADCEEVCISPDGMIVPTSRYCAGDIYPKIDAMQEAMALETDMRIISAYQRQIQTIMDRRKLTPLEDVDFSMQQKWIPRAMIKQFLESQGWSVRYGSVQDGEREDAVTGKMIKSVSFVEDYDTPFGEWQIGATAGRGYNKEISWNKKLQGFDLRLEGYLNGRSITHNLDSTDADLQTQYREREAALNEGLTAFIQTHPDVETVLEQFNRKFNSYIPFEYGTEDLKLEGITDAIKLHTYQNAAVRRLSEEGSGILGFGVGLGKTFSALALAKYNHQMGRSRRTCIVVPLSVLSNWYHDAKTIYGDMSDILFVGVQPETGKDGTISVEPVLDEQGQPKVDGKGNIIYKDKLRNANSAEEVYADMWRIPGSNYKTVVMTKDRFKIIPVKPETIGAYAEDMKAALANSKAGQDAMDKSKKKGKSYADAVEEAVNDANFHNEGTEKEKAYPYLEDMGFSDVISDESHTYKNLLGASARFGRTAYLPTVTVSQIGMDMSIKMNYIKRNNNNRGVILLTATPITNSLIECYNMLSLVVPKEEFERRDIYTVDDFIVAFGDIKPVDKINTENEINTVDGLVGYQNLEGLRDLFFKYTNSKSTEDVEELRTAIPEADRQDLTVEMTSEQVALYAMLREQGKKSKKKSTPKEEKRPLFSIIRDMDKVTTDLDLYYSRMTWHFPIANKDSVDAMIASLPATVKGKGRPEPGDEGYDYDKTEEQQKIREVQIKLTSNFRTEIMGAVYVVVTPQAYEDSVLSRLDKYKLAAEDISHPITPKYAALIENCQKEMNAGGKQIIFSEEKGQHKKIVRLFVHNIPALRNRIGIINAEEAAGNELQKITDAYNSGVLLYVICNRKAEVGVNLQKGTTAIHHLTFPWTKAAMIQRDGRGLRQGNTAKKVTIYKYQGAGTFDMYRMDLIEHKGALIDDLVSGQGNRTVNQDANEDAGLSLMLEDNPEAAKRSMQEKAAKKAGEDAERVKRSLFNQFQAFSANSEALVNLELNREKKRAELQGIIDEGNKNVTHLKNQALGFSEYSPSRTDYSKRVIKEQEKVDKAVTNLSSLDYRYDAQKTDLTRKVAQSALTLRAKAKKGELPFDASLLDHPDNCVISPDGKTIISVGDMFEVSRYEGAKVAVIKITETKNSIEQEKDGKTFTLPFKGFDFEELTAHDNSGYGSSNLPQRLKWEDGLVSLSRFLSRDSGEPFPVKVTYSEKEILLMNLLAKKIEKYSNISELLDKDTFTEFYSKLQFGYFTFVGRENGKLGLFYGSPNKEITVAYPDVKDENFRKAVAESYLANIRDGGIGEYQMRDAMLAVFGGSYKEAVLEYGRKATEPQVLAACETAWKAYLKDAEYAEGEAIPPIAVVRAGGDIVSAAKSLGDNVVEITAIAQSFCNRVKEQLTAKVEIARLQEEREALAALRNDPNFKEVPEAVKAAFDKMGITVKTNTTNMVLPGFKGRAGTPTAPFTKWYFQDSNAKSGILFRVKDMLKARYGAAYFKDAGGEFMGSWWYMPATVDLAKVYELMA